MCENSQIRTSWHDAINRNRPYLKNNIGDDDLKEILDELLSNNTISDAERERILSNKTRCDKIGYLVDVMQLKGEEKCYNFAKLFQSKRNQDHIWKYLSKESTKCNKTTLDDWSDDGECTEQPFVDIPELVTNLSDETITIEQIRTKSYHEDLKKMFGKHWKLVLRRLEGERHPVRNWAAEVCGILKETASDQEKHFLNAIHSEICNKVLNVKKNCGLFDNVENFSSLTKPEIFKIIFQFCHKVIQKAGEEADKQINPKQTIVGLFILFEVAEMFRGLFNQADLQYTATVNVFPVVHSNSTLDIERIGQEWFLKLRFDKYLNLRKHKSLKDLNMVECLKGGKPVKQAVYNAPRYWPSFDKSLLEEIHLEDGIMHTLSKSKVFEKVTNAYSLPPQSTTNYYITESSSPEFHFSQTSNYFPVITQIQSEQPNLFLSRHLLPNNANLQCYFLGNNENLTERYQEMGQLYFDELNLSLFHRVAVQTVHHLLYLKGVKLDPLHMRTCCLWVLENNWEAFENLETFEDIFIFLDATYSALAEMTEKEYLPCYCHKNVNLFENSVFRLQKENIRGLATKFGDEKLTKMHVVHTDDYFQDFVPKSMYDEETYNVNIEKSFFLAYFFLIQYLLVSSCTDITFWEVGKEMYFNIQFAILSYIILSLFVYFLLFRKALSLALMVAIICCFERGIFETWNNLSEMVSTFHWYYRNYVMFSIILIISVKAICIVLYSMLHQRGQLERPSPPKDCYKACKVYTHINMQNQEISRSNWIANSSSFDTPVVPKLLSLFCEIVYQSSMFTGAVAESPFCLGVLISNCYSKLNQSLQIIPSLIPLACVMLYHFLFQRDCKIYWTAFIINCICFSLISDIYMKITGKGDGITLFNYFNKALNVNVILTNIVIMKTLLWISLRVLNFAFGNAIVYYFKGYNIYAGGLPFVDFFPLVIIYCVSNKLFRIHSGKLSFPQKRTQILFETMKYHNVTSDDSNTTISFGLIYSVLKDLWCISVWTHFFVTDFILDK